MDASDARPGLTPELLAILDFKLTHDVPLNTAEAAALRGCASETMVRDRVRGGEDVPPFVRIGRAVRYPARPYVAWLRERPTVRSTSEADAA